MAVTKKVKIVVKNKGGVKKHKKRKVGSIQKVNKVVKKKEGRPKTYKTIPPYIFSPFPAPSADKNTKSYDDY